MRASTLLLLAVCAGPSARGQEVGSLPLSSGRDFTAQEYAAVELRVTQGLAQCYVNEAVELSIRFSFQRDFLEDNLVQLFRQDLDIPVQILAPWVGGLPETVLLEDDDSAGALRGPSFALNHAIGHAREARAESEGVAAFEYVQRIVPQRSGPLHIPAPVMRFAFATRFDDDLISGRVAADREDGYVQGQPLVIEVRELPREGQPFDFSGAVGDCSFTVHTRSRNLRVGESFQLELRFAGTCYLHGFEPPRLDRLAGFKCYGSSESAGAGERTITFDLAPSDAGVRAIPELRWSYFDPALHAYRTLASEPIPVEVRPAEPPDAGPPDTGPGGADAPPPGDGREVAQSARSRPWLVAPWALVLGLVAALAVRVLRRRAAR